jgi:tetratricopeptide (TPR) repeat protein
LTTILFTDVVGSTEISSVIGDGAADELRRRHFDDLMEAIAATNGKLVKTIGDSVMASYSSAADALNGAVEMQRAVARRNRRSGDHDLHIRIGVSAGDASFEEGDWFGMPVVEASRLCSAAATDQILISDLVAALAGNRVDHPISRLGPRELKGLAGPISVSEVGWHIEGDSSTVPLPGFVDTDPSFAFAGRAAQLEVVQLAWKDAIEQRSRVVLISGEPGVGKTRLVTEFVRTAHDDGGIVLWGRCDEDLDVPYQPFAEAMRLFVGSISDDHLREDLGPVAADLLPLVPDLAKRVAGLSIVPLGDADAERLRLFEAVGEAFSAIARAAPVVLVLDDIHWAEKPTLLLLRYLLRRSEPVALLILCTYRDTDLDRSHPLSDVLADLRRETGVQRVDLDGLDLAEITTFMEAAAGHDLDAAGLELARAVHRETEGNPFFLSEMIRHLAESGYIVERDGRWQSNPALSDAGIPEGIREVVGRRLSGLSDAANTALSIAAVIGPEFDASTIEGADGPSGDELFDALDEAARAAVIREVAGAYGRYAFAHALVRSTLYEELSTNRRVRLHWKVGSALAARYSQSPEYADQLAHHFAEGALAGDPLVAVEYCVKAAERATADLAYEAATRSYERALGAIELLGDQSLERRVDIEIARLETLRDSGTEDMAAASVGALAAVRRLADPLRLARVVLAMDRHQAPSSDSELLALATEALDGLGPDPTPMHVDLMAMLLKVGYWIVDATERIEIGRRAIATARALGDTRSLSRLLSSSWALVDAVKPFADEVREYAQEALELSPPGSIQEIRALESLFIGSAVRGETDDALAYVRRLSDAAAAARLSSSISRGMVLNALMSTFVGDIERSEAEANAALDYMNRRGMAESALGAYGGLLFSIRRAQGRLGELIPVLEGLVESQPFLPVWRMALAGAAFAARRSDVVQTQFDWFVADRCAKVPLDVQYPITLCGLARLSPSVDVDDETAQFLYDTLLPFGGLMNFSGISISDANDIGLACVAERLGHPDAADRHFQSAIALADKARAVPYSCHYRYEWARALVERGDVERARPLLIEVAERAEGRDMHHPEGYVAWAADLLASLS